ncbi:MAG: hypothetical protein E5V92_09990 [Mesorhizobium sp.]|nr:MAG: hypothetical protein E5V92_09990 [Mesorhizobium sp.]
MANRRVHRPPPRGVFGTWGSVRRLYSGTVRNSVREAMVMKRRESSHGYREGTSGATACRSRSE